MRIKITSHRGHHEAVLDEPQVAEQFFNKMVGKETAALPPELKTKVPDTFVELESIWKNGNPGYSAYTKKGDMLEKVVDFNPAVEEVLFISPIIGG